MDNRLALAILQVTMSVRTTHRNSYTRVAPTGAAGTLHGPAVTAKAHLLAPACVATSVCVSAEEMHTPHAQNAPPMTVLLANTAQYLGPFVNAFGETAHWYASGKMRHELVGCGWNRTMTDVQKWVKIGGKNGMEPEDVHVLLRGAHYTEAMEQINSLFPDHRVGFVFDGDNHEPYTTPFSKLIADLIDAGNVVVAVKEDTDVSQSFYNGWIGLARRKSNFLFVSAPDIKKEKVTEAADGFVYYGTTYRGTKDTDYRFRLDGTSTQGYSEVEALRALDNVDVLRDGSEGSPLVVLRRES